MERAPDMNPLRQLREHGQSYWLDNLSREMIVDGELDEYPEQAFYMVGGVDEVPEKAKTVI